MDDPPTTGILRMSPVKKTSRPVLLATIDPVVPPAATFGQASGRRAGLCLPAQKAPVGEPGLRRDLADCLGQRWVSRMVGTLASTKCRWALRFDGASSRGFLRYPITLVPRAGRHLVACPCVFCLFSLAM